MAQLKSLNSSVKSAWQDAGGWVILAVVVLVLFSFRKLFTVVGGAAGDIVESAAANQIEKAKVKLETAAADSQKKTDKLKVQTASGSKVTFSDDQIAQFRADATSLAGYLGQLKLGMSTVFKDQQSAFSLIKQHYSTYNLYNNAPWKYKDKAKRTGVVPQSAITSDSVKNPYNWKVLVPFYKEVTEGRDLQGDFRYFVTGSQYKKFLPWILS
jgi:Sec-independent protein translocase protein TatA